MRVIESDPITPLIDTALAGHDDRLVILPATTP